MTDRLTVLITVAHLAGRSGLTLYVRDLAMALHHRGHRPIVYSSDNGAVADQLRSVTIPVADTLDAIGTRPDLIHGHNHFETLLALLRFPGVPAVLTCHGWASYKNAPLRHPRVRRYLPVDDTCRDRLVFQHGISPDAIETHYNFVDMARFVPRAPLPPRPERAFVFASKLPADHLALLREACAARGIALDVLGAEGTLTPEALLRDYDLVFARGRCALEAMAVGAALVVCGREGLGPLVTTANFDELRRVNFGMRAFRRPVTADAVARALDGYDAEDAARVSARIRDEASLDAAVQRLIATYAAVAGETASADRTDEDRAVAQYVEELTAFYARAQPKPKGHRAPAALARFADELVATRAKHDTLAAAFDRARGEYERGLAHLKGKHADELARLQRRMTGLIEGLHTERAAAAATLDAERTRAAAALADASARAADLELQLRALADDLRDVRKAHSRAIKDGEHLNARIEELRARGEEAARQRTTLLEERDGVRAKLQQAQAEIDRLRAAAQPTPTAAEGARTPARPPARRRWRGWGLLP
jgi:hypothetical protein